MTRTLCRYQCKVVKGCTLLSAVAFVKVLDRLWWMLLQQSGCYRVRWQWFYLTALMVQDQNIHLAEWNDFCRYPFCFVHLLRSLECFDTMLGRHELYMTRRKLPSVISIVLFWGTWSNMEFHRKAASIRLLDYQYRRQKVQNMLWITYWKLENKQLTIDPV